MENETPTRIGVGPSQAGERIDRFLALELHPDYSRSFLAQLVRERRVRVNGSLVRPAHRVATGDEVEVELGPPPVRTPLAEELPLRVLYEDEDLIVIDKPPGLLVHPAEGHAATGTLVNGLLFRFPEIQPVGAVERPGIVHRLDRLTSGVLLVARTNRARERLVAQFKARTVKKEYRAVVVGKVPLLSDYIDLPIGNDPRHHERMRIDVGQGKPSSTFYKISTRYPGFTEILAFPLTGRTHQIRIHLAHLGHPVVLDGIYGKSVGTAYRRFCDVRTRQGLRIPSIHRHALHAWRIHVIHPVDGRPMSFEAPVPADYADLLSVLGEVPTE